MEKGIPYKWKIRVAIFIADKIDFKTKTVTREENYIIIKGSIQEEDIIFVNICTQYRKLKYIKQILTDIKGEVDNNTIIAGDFNIPCTSINILSRYKVNKEAVGQMTHQTGQT